MREWLIDYGTWYWGCLHALGTQVRWAAYAVGTGQSGPHTGARAYLAVRLAGDRRA